MSDEAYPLLQVLKDDPRYPLEAYMFVRESLRFASDVLEMGVETDEDADEAYVRPTKSKEKHLTGQQLCEAIRQFALNQYGYMATVVLKEWGIDSTSDFGNIVYNMISAGLMRKSENDQREDFDGVYDFATEFDSGFEIATGVTRPRH